MRGELIVVEIAFLLICIVFSGCFNDENNDEITNGLPDDEYN